MMANRFDVLPDDLQDYIHRLALNKILSEHYFQRINNMGLAITLLKYLGGPSDSNPDYCITVQADGDSILDFNNPYVLRVLSYAAKHYNPNFSKYFNVDNDWWFYFVSRCYSDIETTFEELEYDYLIDANLAKGEEDAHLEFCNNLTSARDMVNRIYFKEAEHRSSS